MAENLVIASNEPADDLSLVDALDHVLNTGVVIRGSVVISIAGVDLIYLGLDLILTSVETALRHMHPPATAGKPMQNNPKAK